MEYKIEEDKKELYNERQKIININDFPKNMTIISNMCLGGRLYHDYHQKFLTPTIDFYMNPDDFIKFCSNLKYYLNYKLKPLPSLKFCHLEKFIFCDLNGLIVGFSHTNDSYEKILKKWEERKRRVNYNNIVIICTDRNILTFPYTRCSENTIMEFEKLPYRKIMFSIKKYDSKDIIYLPSFSKEVATPEATRPSLTKKGKYIIEEDGFDIDEFICKKV